MSKQIKRHDWTSESMDEGPNGDWVRWADHMTIEQNLRAKIIELEHRALTSPSHVDEKFDEEAAYEAAKHRDEQMSRMGSFVQGAKWMWTKLRGERE